VTTQSKWGRTGARGVRSKEERRRLAIQKLARVFKQPGDERAAERRVLQEVRWPVVLAPRSLAPQFNLRVRQPHVKPEPSKLQDWILKCS
jgi:hypothetical protein